MTESPPPAAPPPRPAWRDLPAVEAVLAQASAELAAFGRPLVTDLIRARLAAARAALTANPAVPAPTLADLLAAVRAEAHALTTPTLRPVINATGVILHTNLGRAPLAAEALAAMHAVGQGYNTLEFDLGAGGRGSRTVHAETLLTRLTGAPAALVVNNAASALLLALSALAKGRPALIGRSQLIEIGGGFRVPEVMQQSGVKLVEVGATNRTRLADYRAALTDRTALIVRAHASNFQIIGFAEDTPLAELVTLGVPVLDDIGSGALLDTAAFGLAHEPTVQESVQAGAALTIFSGDKLLGGPQAGIIVGRADLLARLKKHPLARAIRADKTILAGLAATLNLYLTDRAVTHLPIWQMIAAPLAALEVRARAWQAALAVGQVVPAESAIGGGSLPGQTLPTWALALSARHPNRLAARLRALPTPIIARVNQDAVLFDPRTVLPREEADLLAGLRAVFAS